MLNYRRRVIAPRALHHWRRNHPCVVVPPSMISRYGPKVRRGRQVLFRGVPAPAAVPLQSPLLPLGRTEVVVRMPSVRLRPARHASPPALLGIAPVVQRHRLGHGRVRRGVLRPVERPCQGERLRHGMPIVGRPCLQGRDIVVGGVIARVRCGTRGAATVS